MFYITPYILFDVSQGMNYYVDEYGLVDVGDSYFMGYHTPLKKSSDWYESLKSVRMIAENITTMINNNNYTNRKITVFPYRFVACISNIPR